jgi:phenylpropionate dioxygenase-like ring-hydroxylating dioxygenase large terminal subunit
MHSSFAKGWYAILLTSEVKSKPLAMKRLGVDLVVWRDKEDNIVVMHDRCPHRSAKLSLGKLCNGNISCPFHGFEFDNKGVCQYAPEFNKAIPGLKATTYPVQVHIDMVWVYFGGSDSLEQLPTFVVDSLTTMHQKFKGKYSVFTKVWTSHITRCIENQLDYTHLPHVHKTTIGRGFKLPTDPQFIKDKLGVKSFQVNEVRDATTEYIFPNAWILNVSNKMKLLVYFVPITKHETKLYLLTYQGYVTANILKPLVDIAFNYSNRIILQQDQQVVQSQGTQSSLECKHELLMKHDTAIRLFRELWQENL